MAGHTILKHKGKKFFIGEAFKGDYVAIRTKTENEDLDVFFCNTRIKQITL